MGRSPTSDDAPPERKTLSYTPEQILAIDEWSAEAKASVQTALCDDPDLLAAVRRWAAVSSRVGDDLRRDLPATESLVLFALAGSRHADDLTAGDRQVASAAAEQLDAAIENHPAVRHILDRIQDDADDFARCWDEAVRTPSERSDREPVRARPLMRLLSPRWITAAAAVVVLAVSTMLLFGPATDGEQIVWTAEAGSYRLVDLPDGSDLRLTGPATLTYEESQPRTVTLTGSAYFDVAPGESRFTITTATATVEVLGTSFGVLSDDASTEVTLVTGSLRLASADGRTVQLEPGQSSRVDGFGAPEAPRTVDITDGLRWTGLFVFRDTPLSDVARTLGKEYGIHIEISDDLRDETLTGTFAEEQGASEILRVISAAMSAELDVSDDRTRYTLRR